MSEEEPDAGSDDNSNASQPSPPEDIENQVVSLKRIWQNFGTVNNLSFLEKVFQVQKVRSLCHRDHSFGDFDNDNPSPSYSVSLV
jgi:hypothetical protein